MTSSRALPAIWLSLFAIWSIQAFASENNLPSTGLVEGNTLEDFFTSALDFSPTLRIAEENLNISSARERAAKGRLRPQVNASGRISDNRRTASNQFQEFDGDRYSISLTQALFDWQAYKGRKAASFIENQYEAEYYYELALLLTDVAEKYFAVLFAQDALDSLVSELDAVSNQLDQIQNLYDRQLAQITDLYQGQASVAAVQAEQLQLESDLAQAQEALRSLSGIDVGVLFELADSAEIPAVENSVQYWVQRAQERNQQILAREFAVQAAQERISESKGAYMPRVTFIAQQQESNLGFDNALIDQTDTTYLALDVTIPLYAGGSNRASVSEAMSMRNIAENELRQVQLQASARVRSAYLQVQSSEAKTQAARVLLESTTLSAEAMQQGFALGTVTSVDVLNALRDQYRAERDVQRARYEHIAYLLLLKLETGTLEAEDMLEVGNWLVEPSTAN